MNSIQELRQHKAALKIEIQQQREQLQKTFGVVKTAAEPRNLLRNLIQSNFDTPNKLAETAPRAALGLIYLLPLLGGKWGLWAKMALPFFVRFFQNKNKTATHASTPPKVQFYRSMRKGVQSLRQQLKPTTPPPPEN